MFVVNKKVCEILIAKKKWRPIMCALCANDRRHSDCSNWKLAIEQEDREYEEKVTKFDERQNFSREGVDNGGTLCVPQE